jgi:hypothetical protein
LASAWAWVDSNPANNSARHTHATAKKRCARPTSNWLLPIKPVKLFPLVLVAKPVGTAFEPSLQVLPKSNLSSYSEAIY